VANQAYNHSKQHIAANQAYNNYSIQYGAATQAYTHSNITTTHDKMSLEKRK